MKTLLIPVIFALTSITAHADTTKLDGTWCEPDTKVGCYTFKGTVVIEEAVSHSNASKGTWMQDEDMLILTFKDRGTRRPDS